MKNTARVGNQGELAVQHNLERKGWTYGSRRHIGGPGDGLAVKPGYRSRIIEVKKTKTAWSHFGPGDRRALLEYAEKHDLDPELAWVVGDTVRFLPAEAWPDTN